MSMPYNATVTDQGVLIFHWRREPAFATVLLWKPQRLCTKFGVATSTSMT